MSGPRIDGFALHPIRMPLGRTVTWASSSESHADYMILELRAGGVRGVAEGTVKLTFAGETLRTLACAFEDIFGPRLIGVDAGDARAVATVLAPIREHRLAHAMVDAALADLRAAAAGQPLWRFLGGRSASVPLSYTVTRGDPAAMARDAEHAVAGHGFATLKVKTGQGLARDAEALDAIRAAVGAHVRLYADSNRAYSAEDVAAVTAVLAEREVVCAEDPCPLAPNRAFARIKDDSDVMLLVDGPCRDLPSAKLFVESGAEALSVKVGKSGIAESLAIVGAASDAGANVHVGMLAEAGLGALTATSLSSAMGETWLPCESSYFLQLPETLLAAAPQITGGALTLPDGVGLAPLVDWAAVKRLAP
ncbi:MAG TPA: enolase C-terminal domain-like protein [Alphaproteobacteria bacterium]|nr:enolase C-terminal domain-like protein [Alphaproteobacteria bacterium]